MTKESTNKPIVKMTPELLRIIKIATCPNCTGKFTLTYHFGCNADNQVYARIMANSGGGIFSNEWVKLSDIQAVLDDAPFPLTSFPLIKLFSGKSVNTPGFLLAILKHEGLIKLLEGKVRGYEKLDPKPFMLELDKLVRSNINLKPEPVPTTKKISPAIVPKKSKQA
jgi:hypothetical protein